MFGRHPRLAIDALLGIGSSEEHKSHQDYEDRPKDRLQYAVEKNRDRASKKEGNTRNIMNGQLQDR